MPGTQAPDGAERSATQGGLAGGPRHGRRRAGRRRRRVRRVVVIVGAVLVLLVAAVVGYNWHLFNQIHTVAVKGLSAQGSGAELGTENVLMVGSTDRCDLPKSDPLYQDCVQGHTGINSDVVMILHLVAATKQVSVLSIPRDTFVPNARAEGANKIDAALAEGPSQLVAAIEDDFGIPIQHYVELNFASFANVVQTIGGIHMYFPEPVYDAQVGLDIASPGCTYLNGGDALKLVRSRELQYKGPGVTTNNPAYWTRETQNDLARIQRDHEFLRVLATAVAHHGLGNPITDEKLIASIAPQLEVDAPFKGQLLSLAGTFHGVNPNQVPELTLPVRAPDIPADYFYKGFDYGEIVYPTATEDENVIDQFLGVTSGTDTMTGRPLPRPKAITVSVLNGTGVTDQAADTGAALHALGFTIGALGDTAPVGAPAETLVTYDSTAGESAAETVARSLSGLVVLARGATAGGSQVTVTTGSDFSVDSPPAVPASTSSTTAAPPVTTGTALGPASAPVSPLRAWDPRACGSTSAKG
jgi:LCP family protein required for cell wall assembly